MRIFRMRFLPELFKNNRAWAARSLAADPQFFLNQSEQQQPGYLWIGCADSRVPANEIVGLPPGELFVHRNVANLVAEDDDNAMAVLQYGIEVLKIPHVIVCGHYGCGGVNAALADAPLGAPLDAWIGRLQRVRDANKVELEAIADGADRSRRLCELNVAAQVRALSANPIVRAAWARKQPLFVHGWIYELREGLLRDLGLSADRPAAD